MGGRPGQHQVGDPCCTRRIPHGICVLVIGRGALGRPARVGHQEAEASQAGSSDGEDGDAVGGVEGEQVIVAGDDEIGADVQRRDEAPYRRRRCGTRPWCACCAACGLRSRRRSPSGWPPRALRLALCRSRALRRLVLGWDESNRSLGRIGRRHGFALGIDDLIELIARVAAEGVVLHGE